MNSSRDAAQLERAASAVAHELVMVKHCLEILNDPARADLAIYPLALEAFLVHLRNVIYFFFADEPREDDIVAGDFFDGAEQWLKYRPPAQLLLGVRDDIERLVGPLTYWRITAHAEEASERSADLRDQFAAELRETIRAFLQGLPMERSRWLGAVGW